MPDADDDDDDDEDDVPLALERWRSGVSKASNIAQLSMCLEELDAQVAWEKSVMKAVRRVFVLAEAILQTCSVFSLAKFVEAEITNRSCYCATVVTWAITLIVSRYALA